MSWPPRQPAKAELSNDAELRAYEEVIARAAKQGMPNPEIDAGYYGRLLSTPLMAATINRLGHLSRAAGDTDKSFSHADREWVNQVLALELKTELVQEAHLPDGLSAGVRLEAIEALRAGREEELTEYEALLTQFIRRVLHGRMDDETWSQVQQRLGERGVMEYAIFVLFLQFTLRLFHCATGATGASKEQIDTLLQDYKTGKLELPDYRKRIT